MSWGKTVPGVFENYQVAALLVCTVALVWRYHTLNQRQHTFSEYSHIANSFGFVGHVVSITITQLCHLQRESRHRQYTNEWTCLSSIKLYLQNKWCRDWVCGLWFADSYSKYIFHSKILENERKMKKETHKTKVLFLYNSSSHFGFRALPPLSKNSFGVWCGIPFMASALFVSSTSGFAFSSSLHSPS